MIKLSTYGILFHALLLVMAGCRSTPEEAGREEAVDLMGHEIVLSEAQVELAGIQAGKLEEKILSEEIRCNGTVELPPGGRISISLPMDGYVKSIHVNSGSEVRKGDLLAVMNHPHFLDLQREYLVTGNNLQMLKEDLDRQEILAREDAASGKKLTSARTEYENAKVHHYALGEQLKMLGIQTEGLDADHLRSEVRIHSPINGFVRKNYANTGEMMHAGDPIMELEDNSDLLVQLVIYEKDIGRIRQGQEVEFTTGKTNRDYTGKVHTVGKSIDEKTRSGVVLVTITNPDEFILSGMYVRARVLIDQVKVYALPESGIVREGDQAYLFAQKDSTFKRIPVTTGISKDGYVEIKSPENLTGLDLVTAGAYYLNAGFQEE
jgi:cobalt-zinc-cadmium efflux system membrane fusion protein